MGEINEQFLAACISDKEMALQLMRSPYYDPCYRNYKALRSMKGNEDQTLTKLILRDERTEIWKIVKGMKIRKSYLLRDREGDIFGESVLKELSSRAELETFINSISDNDLNCYFLSYPRMSKVIYKHSCFDSHYHRLKRHSLSVFIGNTKLKYARHPAFADINWNYVGFRKVLYNKQDELDEMVRLQICTDKDVKRWRREVDELSD